MFKKSVAAASVLGSAALATLALSASPSIASTGPESAPAAVQQAAHPQSYGKHKVRFDLARSAGVERAGCLPYAKARVTVEGRTGEEVEIMRVYASGLPKDTEFDFFVLQQPDLPFGMSWYQGDLQSDEYGRAYVKYVGRFNEETFSVAPNVLNRRRSPTTSSRSPTPTRTRPPRRSTSTTSASGSTRRRTRPRPAAGAPPRRSTVSTTRVCRP